MKLMDETKQLMFDMYLEIHTAKEDYFRESMNAPDYVYKDISWCRFDLWDDLIDIIQPEEMKIIATTATLIKGEMFRRGQFMISPKGMENIRNYNEQNKKEAETKESNGDSS